MASNNAEKIAEIRALLQTGASSVAVDGQQTTFDLASLRQELRRLEEEDATAQTKRPFCATINLDGW